MDFMVRSVLRNVVNVRTEHFVITSPETALKDVKKSGRAKNATVRSVCLLFEQVQKGLFVVK